VLTNACQIAKINDADNFTEPYLVVPATGDKAELRIPYGFGQSLYQVTSA